MHDTQQQGIDGDFLQKVRDYKSVAGFPARRVRAATEQFTKDSANKDDK
ncbi:MAG TPA: hypothetical protein VN361_06595 [Oxalicibacterium sp.]|nr:hypothetical protein [Oxalicibacterium sp.]